jgi:glycerophosphoryl diester phosphodiesterase
MASPRPDPGPRKPAVLAHRGASGYELENSLAAFRRARELGADGVELDVHATRDGVLLVHHDLELPGAGPIPALTASEAARIRLPNGEPVPTLAQALDTLGDLQVWVEVKTLPASDDEVLLRTLAQGPCPAGYAVHSFDHRIVARLGARSETLRRGALSASYLLAPLFALTCAGADTLWQEAHLIDAALVALLHGSGRRIIAWTVNDDQEARRLACLGVDGLCGNYPDRLRAVVDQVSR